MSIKLRRISERSTLTGNGNTVDARYRQVTGYLIIRSFPDGSEEFLELSFEEAGQLAVELNAEFTALNEHGEEVEILKPKPQD